MPEETEQLDIFIKSMINAAKNEQELNHLSTRLYALSKLALLKSVDNISNDQDRMGMFRLKMGTMADRFDDAVKKAEEEGGKG